MATPYFQLRLDSVASTQDEARARLGKLPIAVIAPVQTRGRGRSGAEWLNADRAVAVSLAMRLPTEDRRPFSLMAGVAAARVCAGTALKWPNDVIAREKKVGGLLVERFDDIAVVGFGLDLWWGDPPDGMGSLLDADPGPDRHAEVAGLWAAEVMRMVGSPGWPIDEYRSLSDTIGRYITWEPSGAGEAIGVAEDGGLLVRVGASEEILYSGAVRHVR